RQRVERHLTVFVDGVHVRVRQDLADRLLHAGLGQVAAKHAVAVRPHHARLEPHREGELGDHDRQERQHEDDREQGESALVAGMAAHLHGAFTRMDTSTGGCSTAWPPTIAVSVTSTAFGSERSCTPSHCSSHESGMSRRYRKWTAVSEGSTAMGVPSSKGSSFGSAFSRTAKPGRSPSSTESVTAVKAIGAGSGNGGATVTNDSLSGSPWNSTSAWAPGSDAARYAVVPPSDCESSALRLLACCSVSVRCSPLCHARMATRRPPKTMA